MSMSRSPLLFLVVVLLGLSGTALAKPKVDCKDRCKDSSAECVTICQEHAGPKGRPFCKKACSEGEKSCETKCSKRK